MIVVTFFIVADEIAISADTIASTFGYSINLTAYENLNLYTDYIKILGGLAEVYAQVGAIIFDLLSNHIGQIASLGITRGSPSRFLLAALLPFIAGGIFVGAMADEFKSFIISSLISSFLAPLIGFAIVPSVGVNGLLNAFTFVGFAYVFALLFGILFNILSNKAFEKEEEEEELEEIELKEVDVDLDEEIEIE